MELSNERILAIVCGIVIFIVVVLIIVSRRKKQSTIEIVVDKDCKDYDLLGASVIECYNSNQKVYPSPNNPQLKHIARYIKSGCLSDLYGVYREGSHLYLYGNNSYYMLDKSKELTIQNYVPPKQTKYTNYGFGGWVSISKSSEYTTNPAHLFSYQDQQYYISIAYPEKDQYTGMLENQSTDYQYSINDENNQDLNNMTFYQVTNMNSDKMNLEKCNKQDKSRIAYALKRKSFGVKGIYLELNQLFMYDSATKKHIPLIFSERESLPNTVINYLPLHKPYIKASDFNKHDKTEDAITILCLNENHWFYQDDKSRYIEDKSTILQVRDHKLYQGDRQIIGMTMTSSN